MLDFFNNDEPYEAEPSLAVLLAQNEEEISDTWLLLQNETECSLKDADIDKIEKLIKDLRQLEDYREDLLEAIDRKAAARRELMCRGSF